MYGPRYLAPVASHRWMNDDCFIQELEGATESLLIFQGDSKQICVQLGELIGQFSNHSDRFCSRLELLFKNFGSGILGDHTGLQINKFVQRTDQTLFHQRPGGD